MKYVVVIDTSGSMYCGEWPDVIKNVYAGLREKLLEVSRDNWMTSVYFVTHEIVGHRYLLSDADNMMRYFNECSHKGTDFLPIKQIRDKENADLVFIISDGEGSLDYRWDLEHYVFVTDTPHAITVRATMANVPIPLLIIDKKYNKFLRWIKNTWKKFEDWGARGGTIVDMRNWVT